MGFSASQHVQHGRAARPRLRVWRLPERQVPEAAPIGATHRLAARRRGAQAVVGFREHLTADTSQGRSTAGGIRSALPQRRNEQQIIDIGLGRAGAQQVA